MTRPRRGARVDRLLGHDAILEPGRVTAEHMVGPVDEEARRMALKWGEDRLPDLVSLDLAERFGRQREKLERALAACDHDALRIECPKMLRAYAALDAAAEAAGAKQLVPEVFEVTVDGAIVGIVRDAAAWRRYAAQRPDAKIYTVEEIGRLLSTDFLRAVTQAKTEFPGAVVTDARSASTRIGRMLDDAIPF